MNINDAKQQVKNTVAAYLATNEVGQHRIPLAKQRPLFLLGAPGIGKTAIMSQVAQEMGIGLVSYSMTHHTRQSALGLPRIVHHTYEDLEYDASEYTMSEIVAAVYDFMDRTGLDKGILFLDEINCVSETLYPSMLQFLQFKTFGQHRIPDNWVVVCAGNPPEYNRSVHEFDIVTMDRLRKVVIEPELEAWRTYAIDRGMHPAILSFLDVKNSRFYAVESTPEGKVFVTARGWEDLSEVMKVFDDLDLPIDLQLIQQFIQKEDIAEEFALYYELFKKYRSDYQIDTILDGSASEEIYERAKVAPFDERLALIGLILDRLNTLCAEVLEKEAVVSSVRDILRTLKDPLMGGATLDATLKQTIDQRESDAAARARAGVLSEAQEHCERMVIMRLKEFYQTCVMKGTTQGEAAFDTIHYSYRGLVGDLEQSVKHVQRAFDNAFAYFDQVFEDEREGLVFVTELTARQATSKFIGKFNSESYYRHNDRLMVDGHRDVLFTRIDELLSDAGEGEGSDEVAEERTDEESSNGSDAAAVGVDENAGDATIVADAAGAADVPGAPSSDDAASVSEEIAADALPAGVLADYYAGSQIEYGFASLCKMTLPENLGGKNILDIGCRRGKGVYKLSSRVGDSGHVTGIDWVPEYIDQAEERQERAWQKSGLRQSNMNFMVGYPEDLSTLGLRDEAFDVIFINSVFNLTYDPERVLKECYRVLKPNGMIILETIFAEDERDENVVAKARAMGNSIQAAPSKAGLKRMIAESGFREMTYMNEHAVQPSDGALPDRPVPVVETDEAPSFKACVIHVVK